MCESQSEFYSYYIERWVGMKIRKINDCIDLSLALKTLSVRKMSVFYSHTLRLTLPPFSISALLYSHRSMPWLIFYRLRRLLVTVLSVYVWNGKSNYTESVVVVVVVVVFLFQPLLVTW